MNKLCGHNRDAVKAVLRSLKEYEDFGYKSTPTPSQFYITCSDPAWSVDDAEAIRQDISDPAKLAEMLAERGRQVGWHVCSTDCLYDDTAPESCDGPGIEVSENVGTICIAFGDGRKARAIHMTMPQARALLAAWLALPDGDRVGAEKALREING